jgi:hypothetical protein
MLIVVTMMAVLAAVALGALAWRMAQDERRRSDARVAALVASLEAAPEAEALADAPTLPATPFGEIDVELRRPLFVEPARDEADGFSRLLAVGLVAVVLFTGVAAAWLFTGAPVDPTPSAQAGVSEPIELLSLSSSRRGPELSVDGLVRNPSAGTRLEGIAAVVLFFDDRGGFLTSARAPLNLRVLSPGESSPFHLTVTAPEGTSRYRVSFRIGEGGIVSHVDRRPARLEHGAPESPAVRRAGL